MDKLCSLELFLFNSLSEKKKESLMKSLMSKEEMKSEENYQTLEMFEEDSIKRINHDAEYSLEDKVEVTRKMLKRADYLPYLSEEFYEEECHLSLVNWIWNEMKMLKKKGECPNQEKFNSFLELINNIIFIIQKLQISQEDILGLKLYEKLNKIKNFISILKVLPQALNSISFLLQNWKVQVEKNSEKLLNKKRQRKSSTLDNLEEDTEDESGKCSPKSIISFTDLNSIKLDNIKPKKVSFNLLKNDVIYYDKTKEPFSIHIQKNNYDPTIF